MGRFSLLGRHGNSVYDDDDEEEEIDRMDEEGEEEQQDQDHRMMMGYRNNCKPRYIENKHVVDEDSQEDRSSTSSSIDDNDHYEQTHHQRQYRDEDYEYDQWKRRRQDEAEEYDRFQNRKSTSSSVAWRHQQPQPQQQLVRIEDRMWSEVEEEQQGVYNNDDDDSMAVVSSEEEENGDSRRLRSRRQRHHDDGHRPIHYHIHLDGREVLADGGAHLVEVLQRLLQRQVQQQPLLDYPDEEPYYTRRLRAINWQSCFHAMLALVAVMAHINYWYINDGSSNSGERGNWWWSWKNTMRSTQHVPRPASFDFPDLWTLHDDVDDVWRSSSTRLLPIRGQEVALDAVERRLQRWANAMKATTTTFGGRRQRPLVLYLTGGGPAVGKHSLAYKILQQMTRRRTISTKSQHGEFEESALEVCQRQWNGSAVNEATSACPMIRIVDPAMLPILKEHSTDDEDSTPLLLLLSRVDEWTDSAQVVQDILEHIQYHRPNTLVIMTSNVGTTTQEKWMRKQLQQQQQQQKPEDASAAQRLSIDGLIPLLEYEVRKFHGMDNDYGNTFGWTVVPFVPLDRDAIRFILQDLVVTQAPFDLFVTPAALDRWLDDHLEWLQWIHKTSEVSLRQWSATGVRQVQQLWEDRIVTALLEQETKGCVTRGDSSNRHVLDVDEGLAERFILQSCRSIGGEGRSKSHCDGRTLTGDKEATALCCPYDGTACRFYV